MSIRVTTLVKFYVLFLLYGKEKHGYELMKELREKLDRKISPNQVYPFLKKLKNQGYLKSKKVGDRDKRVYHLTKEGKLFAKRMISRFDELVETAVKPKLSVCIHCGCKVFKGGHTERIKGKRLVFCCQHCAKAYKSTL
jgi:DNA-binding PadR family transcriptional regulator